MADLHSAINAAMTAAAQPQPTPAAQPTPKAAPEPAKAKAQPAPTAAEKKIWKLKADGEEFEFDASNEEAIKQEIMKARGANKRFEEAAKARKEADAQRKEAEEAFAMLKDPAQLKKLLADPRISVDFKKLAEEFVWEQIQEQSLTPEQRKQKELERELAKYKEQEQETLTKKEAAEAAQLQAHYESDYEQRIISALESGGIPKTRGAVRRMAHYLELAVQNGVDVTAQDLVSRVRQDLLDEHREMYGAGGRRQPDQHPRRGPGQEASPGGHQAAQSRSPPPKPRGARNLPTPSPRRRKR